MKSKILKTSLSIVMVLVMLFSVVGCSVDELSYYSLNKEVSELNVIEASGTVSAMFDKTMLDDMHLNVSPEMRSLKDALGSGFDIRYVVKAKKQPLAYEIQLDYRKKGTIEYKKITTIIGNDKVVYLNLKDYINFIKPFVLAAKPSEAKVMNALTAKVEYVQIDLTSSSGMPNYTDTLINSDEMTKVITGFTDLFKEAYADFSSGMITKVGEGYKLSLEAKDIKPLIFKFIEYTMANIDAIVDKTSAKINAMSDKDIAMFAEAMSSPSLDKEELLSGLEDLRKQVKSIPPAELDALKNDPSFDMIFSSIDGSSLNSYLEKTNENTYTSNAALIVKYMGKSVLSLTQTSQIKKLDDFSITKPANVTTLKAMNAIVAANLPVRVNEVKINLKTKKSTIIYSNKKTISMSIALYTLKDGTYAYVTNLNKALGTKITWDDKKKIAQATKDGKVLSLTAKKVNGKVYVKISDLGKLGYTVWTNASAKEISITDSSEQSIFQQ